MPCDQCSGRYLSRKNYIRVKELIVCIPENRWSTIQGTLEGMAQDLVGKYNMSIFEGEFSKIRVCSEVGRGLIADFNAMQGKDESASAFSIYPTTAWNELLESVKGAGLNYCIVKHKLPEFSYFWNQYVYR